MRRDPWWFLRPVPVFSLVLVGIVGWYVYMIVSCVVAIRGRP